jgi:hypothetical protein
MGAAQKERQQANREDDDGDGAERFFHPITAENGGSTIRGVAGNAKDALVVVSLVMRAGLPVSRVPDKIGAFRLRSRFSHWHRLLSFLIHPLTA